jgi:hypothetical protein
VLASRLRTLHATYIKADHWHTSSSYRPQHPIDNAFSQQHPLLRPHPPSLCASRRTYTAVRMSSAGMLTCPLSSYSHRAHSALAAHRVVKDVRPPVRILHTVATIESGYEINKLQHTTLTFLIGARARTSIWDPFASSCPSFAPAIWNVKVPLTKCTH